MKSYSILLLCGPALAWPQSTTTTYQRDLNGRPVAVSTTTVAPDGTKSVELQEDVNGVSVSRQKISEKLLRTDRTSKVTERIIQNFDPQGRPSGLERVLVEETTAPDGTRTVRETTFRSAPNGPLVEQERRTSVKRSTAGASQTEITVEKPGLNRAFQVDERRTIVTSGDARSQRTTETVLRPDVSGRFVLSQRKEIATSVQNGETKTTTSVYENRGGYQPALIRQEIATSTRQPGGVELTQIDTLLPEVAGVAQSAGARLLLQEQQIVERRLNADGSFTETVSVRLPASANPGRLGAPRIISETICEGNCVPPPAPAEAKPTPAPAEAKPAPAN